MGRGLFFTIINHQGQGPVVECTFVQVLYLSVSISCYSILLFYYIPEKHIVPFTALLLFTLLIKVLHIKHMISLENMTCYRNSTLH